MENQSFTPLQILYSFKIAKRAFLNSIRVKIKFSYRHKFVTGFTLIEFLIYVGIVATILIITTGFLWNIIFGNIKETSYQEVQQNGRFALTKINQEIKKAAGINSPPPAGSANSLSLAMADASLNPTIFDAVDGKLKITQGTNGPYELTTDEVRVSNLLFTNLSYENTPGTVQVEMTIDHVNPSNRVEYQASINLNSTFSLVPGGAAAPPPTGYCAGTCTPCENFLDRTTCTTQAGCSWSTKLKKCTGICTPCEIFTDQPSCEAQLGCYWVSG
jgi:Tfp pilus assembly protein PilW